MVHSPIKVKNYENPVESTRKDLLDEENEKIQGNRGFIFKGYKTEKERIEEYLKNKNFYFHDSDHLNNSSSYVDTKQNQSLGGIVQPQMRFKPRTDLERIVESINKNSFGKADKQIVDKQLRGLDLNVTKVKKSTTIADVPDYKEFVTHDNRHQSEAALEPHKRNRDSKKKEMNSEAKHLMKDLHMKTHFKGVTVIAQQNQSII